MNTLVFVVTLVATLGSGLMAGGFFAFSTFVMRALRRLPPHEGIAAMQSINVVVVNSSFIAAFLATAAACVGVLIAALTRRHTPGNMFLLIGSGLYLIGNVVVTMAFSQPLNQALASVAPTAPDSANRWASYVSSWMAWNHVRTGTALAAAVALTLAMLRATRPVR